MLSRISQLKQSLSDEFEQAVGPQRPLNDPVSIIERNAQVLRSETPDPKDIMIESDGEDTKEEPPAASAAAADAPASDSSAGPAGDRSAAPTGTANGTPREGSRSRSPAPAPTGSKESSVEPNAKQGPNGTKNAKRTNGSSRAKSPSTATNSPQNEQTPEAQARADDKAESKSASEEAPAAGTGASGTGAAEELPPRPEASPAPSTKAASPAGSEAPQPETTEPQSRASVESQRPDMSAAGAGRDDPVLAAKLAKFEKYEQKYPGLLKAYKTEKKKNELVRIYEKILSEHTPCSSIAEPQELVNYLTGLSSRSELQQKEIGGLNSEVAKLKAELAGERKKSADTRVELDKLKQRSEQQIAEARAQAQAQADAQQRRDESAQLKEKVTALEQQLAEAEAAGSVAARTQTTLRTQLDELGLRLAETQTELEVVRDELGESERRAQERLQELASVRQALRARDKDRRRSVDEAAAQIAVLTSEKEQLEAEVEVLGRRIVRETEQLHVQLRSARSQLRESEAHAAELQHELEQQSSRYESAAPARPASTKPAEPSPAATHGGAEVAQAQAEAAASGAVKANELLKQVNADNALRIEKLQKAQRALAADLEQLRSENQRLRRRSSVSSGDVQSVDSEKQRAYLRNVLLGFIEHRDQRKMLLPVLATLLGFQDGEEEKLLNNLK